MPHRPYCAEVSVYERSALAYDLLQEARGRDYAGQVEAITEIVLGRCPSAATLLDVACGTGAHLVGFSRRFEVTGVDISAAMLARAREKVPAAALHEADMRTFALGRRFDAVVCLCSSIGYMQTVHELKGAVANLAAHVADGGVLIIEPWLHPDVWRDDHRVAEAANAGGTAVARVSVNGRQGPRSVFTLYWTVATATNVDQFSEVHEMGLFTPQEYVAAMENAGLTVDHDSDGLTGRGLFIASR